MLIVDETGFVKKGASSVGVQRHYTAPSGRIENSQVAAFLTYASPRGRALVDRRLHLPGTSWCDDSERCAAAGVPDEVALATKPELAAQMVGAAHPGHDASPPGADQGAELSQPLIYPPPDRLVG